MRTEATMEADECETRQRYHHAAMPASATFGSQLGLSAEKGGMIEEDEELHRLEQHMEGIGKNSKDSDTSFFQKARQTTLEGLAALKRSISGSREKEREEREEMCRKEVVFGERGYGTCPSSELEQDMHRMMQAAVDVLKEPTESPTRNTTRLHAPELYHPESVTSYEELRKRNATGKEMEGESDIDATTQQVVSKMFDASGEETKPEGLEVEEKEDQSVIDSLGSKATGIVEKMGAMTQSTQDIKDNNEEDQEDDALEMMQMFTPE